MTTTSHHKAVSLDDLVIDQRVQRVEGVDQRRVDKMAGSFNPLALGTVTVWQREDGRLLTDAVMAADNAGRTTERYTHGGTVTPRDVERASHAAWLAQTAAMLAIYDLAAALAADGVGVAS